MIHLLPAWQQCILCRTVRVRVNDNGVDVSHGEFGTLFDEFASCDFFLPSAKDNTPLNYHGTAVAFILGAESDNKECSVSIAPNVTISACNLFKYRTDSFFVEKVDYEFDISQNSFGYPACGPGRRDLQQQPLPDHTCPFTYIHPSSTSSAHPCTVCDFDSSTTAASPKSTACQTAIVMSFPLRKGCPWVFAISRFNFARQWPMRLQCVDATSPRCFGQGDYPRP